MFTQKTMQNSGTINDYLSATTWNKIFVEKVDPKTELDATQTEMMSQARP
jgi:hypothetical protein